MKLFLNFFALLLLVTIATAQLSLVKSQECGENEAFETCGSACEPSCDTPSPAFCTLQCVVGCQCEKGYLRNSDKKCVTSDNCSSSTNSTSTTKVPLSCGRNEVASECHSPCTEKKCPVADPVLVNCILMCSEGCACVEGFVRNQQGECVSESQCPEISNSTSTENPCNLAECRTGFTCENQNGSAVCVEETREPELSGTITCANVRCGTPGGCAMVYPIGCTGPRCIPQPQCIQSNPCHHTRCTQGHECVLQQVTCIRAPCNPVAVCRPQLVPIRKRETGASCMTARCSTPAGCAMIRPSYCVAGQTTDDCKLRPGCIHYNACAATTCPIGKQCVLQEVICVRAPCNPVASCE